MNKKIAILALSTNIIFSEKLSAKDDSVQIDALQNEILKMKQEISSDKGKTYFRKGKGLSIKSADGRYEFEIKGRLMWDMTGIFGGNNVSTGNDPCKSNCSRADNLGTWGNEFRRVRFSIKGKLGYGWGFAFQPDFAETISDNSSTGGKGVNVIDALIYKNINGIGKFSFGNVKSAGGLWENTSSNNLLFMERPMYNEAANLAHRAGIHYDTAGSTKPFHLKTSFTVGEEGAWRQEQEDSDDTEDRWNVSGAGHYTWNFKNNAWSLGKNHKLLIGASWTYESHIDSNTRDIEARANGVHTLGEKIQDSSLANINSYTYGGPQIAYTNGPLFIAGEHYYVFAGREANPAVGYKQYGNYTANGYSAFVHYFFNGNASVPINAKKGAVSGVKCKSDFGCTAIKIMFEGLNFAHSELSKLGTDGKVLHLGINHYFNSNVRLMVDAARGIYQGGTGYKTDAYGTNVTGNMSSIQARLHVMW